MKICKKVIAITCLSLGIVIGANNFAVSDVTKAKIAVVDVPAIVAKSNQVKNLKEEQVKKNQELVKWLEVVKADVNKQSSEENKKKLLKKYNDDFAKKKENIAKDYAKKLAEIDKNISNTISNHAKTNNYDIVLAKSIVLYGGENITDEIIKVIK